MAQKLWAGLDVGVETTSVCVVDDKGGIVHEANCPTRVEDVHREIRFLKRRRYAKVGLETGIGSALARGLQSRGYQVELYEARQLSKFLRLRRNKTDAGDALGIAEAGRLAASNVSRVHLKSLECQALVSRLSLRRHLLRERIRGVNALCRQIEQFGGRIRPKTRAVNLRPLVDAEIAAHFEDVPQALVDNLYDLLRRVEEIYASQLAMDRDLKALATADPVCERLMQIPGVGPLCALTFTAIIEDPARFTKTTNVGSYLGLAPRIHQSGLTSRSGRITRMGNTGARTLLIQASMQFIRWSNPDGELHQWASGVAERSGYRRARVALARKLAVIMLTMWKNGTDFRERIVEA